MNIRSGNRFACLLAFVLFFPAGSASAQAVAGDEPALRLECGGIGLEESQRMRAEVAMHALTLFFSTTEGGFVTDVATRVDDPLADRRVESSCGPIGQLDVPARTMPGSSLNAPRSGITAMPEASRRRRYAAWMFSM